MTKKKTGAQKAKDFTTSYDKDLRRAGVLLHISSLPAAFGVGDLGPEAYAFASFLARAGQQYWQLLPLGPTAAAYGHSPYAALSSMAGNPLLISPELLVQEKLLRKEEVTHYQQPVGSQADFAQAASIRAALFTKAYQKFCTWPEATRQGYTAFCRRQKHWLKDFALFVVLKEHHGDSPWYTWPDPFKFRDKRMLKTFAAAHAAAINRVQWEQYIFSQQWAQLKAHCRQQGIRLFGDLPFYVSYDAADVWANPNLFKLDKALKPAGMAGVPPDYFSTTGQLWGMPVFRWKALKQEGYRWWVRRIRQNMALYDLLRLDHFRAFADYWEVPAGEETAINGRWKKGPGLDFFRTLQKDLGHLPFIAEDLGDISEAVYALRDELKLPGMKVLQFAFGENMGTSAHIPHHYKKNFIAYTGTHDNNTTRGWFQDELDTGGRARVAQYIGQAVAPEQAAETLSRLAYSSVAATVILPWQDIANLDYTARMNTPGATQHNWLWRADPKAFSKAVEKKLLQWCLCYGRNREKPAEETA